jgi:hypothetical protein
MRRHNSPSFGGFVTAPDRLIADPYARIAILSLAASTTRMRDVPLPDIAFSSKLVCQHA